MILFFSFSRWQVHIGYNGKKKTTRDISENEMPTCASILSFEMPCAGSYAQ